MTITDAHRNRLIHAGVEPELLATQDWHLASDGLPDWWAERGNALYLPVGAETPREYLLDRMTGMPLADAVAAVACDTTYLSSLLLGDSATVFLGPSIKLMAGEIFCGADSSIVLKGDVAGTRSAIVDARNGGSIIAEPDQLWAAGVYIATDDMHRLEDATTGERLNPFGAHIRLDGHVWLCREASITGHVEIGAGSVIGARALVRGQKVPPNTLSVGTPARVVRENVTWNGEDLP